jgi:hypothetical protein
MSENHKLEAILAGMGNEPVPQDVHQLAESVMDEFRRGLSAGLDAAPFEPGDTGTPSPSGAELAISRDSIQPTVRRDAHVPTELADGVSRETHLIPQPPGRRHVPRRLIAMFQSRKVRWSVIAAAAAIALVVLGLWPQGDGHNGIGIVFADVVQHFTKASSAKYTVVIELEGHRPVSITRMQDFENRGWPIGDSGPMGIQMLPRDWTSSRGASDPLSEGFEGATLYFFGRADGKGMQDFFQVMGHAYKQAKADLGKREIDGQPAVGFHFEQEGTAYSIWANAATGLPLQIEISNRRLLGQGKITVKDFEFDVDIPTRQYGMGGYLPGRWKWVLSEDELITALRRWAKRHDGQFPASLVHQAWFFNRPEDFRDPSLSIEDKQFAFMGHTQAVVKGVAFANQLPPGEHWTYLGKGMTLDAQDAQTPICWYQPEGSQTYRVIYRNLSIRDVAADKLPPTTVAH